jgi:Xaa-Pro aminopeptidase
MVTDNYYRTSVSNLAHLQARLRTTRYQGLLVPSTDEYLSEFSQPATQRLGWITGFRGSTGLAVVLQDHAALFLDGRYKLQGKADTAGLDIEVLDANEVVRHSWLSTHLHVGQRLAIDTRLQSHPDVERMLSFAAQHGIELSELTPNPIDELWGAERPAAYLSAIIDYPTHFAGAPATEKCAQLRDWLTTAGMDCYLLADPEDVAWLLNVRTHDSQTTTAHGWHIVPIPLSRVLVEVTGNVFWFVDSARLEPALVARLAGTVNIVDPTQFESFLEERVVGKTVGANLRRTPHKFAAIAARVGTVIDDSIVACRRWKKHPNEIARAREAHHRDGQAVIRLLAWIQRTVLERTVTELEAAQKLTELRSEWSGYKGISMPLMSASGVSGAMPHYVPSEHSNRKLNDHPIYWMDSGGQYYGGSTDNTVCIAVGKPEARHIQAHTLVVKGFIALTVARFPAGLYSTQLDSFARQYLWQQGMDYGHATGHGVGSFMNIHEGPHIRKEIHHPMAVPIEVGMIVSNEPAYYADSDFGIRIESHMVTVPSQYDGFVEFETLSRLPIDPRLIDESLLTTDEKRWLTEYHVAVLQGYKGCFDEQTSSWLQGIVDAYVEMKS